MMRADASDFWSPNLSHFYFPVGCKPKPLENGNECPFTKAGETCEVSCKKHSTLRGSRVLTCSEKAEWEFDIEPLCDEYEEVYIGERGENIGCFLKRFFINVKKKCKKKWR